MTDPTLTMTDAPGAPASLLPVAPRIPGVRRIAVLRGGGIGDLVFALPALASIRAAYPDARIDLLGAAWAAELLGLGEPDADAAVDAVVPLTPAIVAHLERRGRLDDPGVDAFVDELTADGPLDLGIQLHGGGAESNPLLRRLGPRLAVGSQAPGAIALDRTAPYVYYQPEVIRDLEVAALAGAPTVALQPHLGATAAGRREADRALAALDGVDRPFVALHPAAGDPRRRWPVASFASVAAALAADGHPIVLVGGRGDAEATASVAAAIRAAGGTVLDLAGRLPLGGLVALFSRAALAVGNDSGPLHVAAAAGAPTVGVYWFGNVINAAPLTRRRHRLAIAWRRECPVCGIDCLSARCPHDASFVADVGVNEVLEAARSLLA